MSVVRRFGLLALGVVLLIIAIALSSQPVGYGCVTYSADEGCPVPFWILVHEVVVNGAGLMGALFVGWWAGWELRGYALSHRGRADAPNGKNFTGALVLLGVFLLGAAVVIAAVVWATTPVEFSCAQFGREADGCGDSFQFLVQSIAARIATLSGVVVTGGCVSWVVRGLRKRTIRQATL